MAQPLIVELEDMLGGMPIFYGTCVPVQTLLDTLTTGETHDTFLDDFPTVTREQAVRFTEQAGATLIAHASAHVNENMD